MATKNVTLRLPEDIAEYLSRNNNSINQAVISEISFLRRIRQVSLGELKGFFTVDEWLFMADTFIGGLKEETFCANKGAFIAACEDAVKFDGLDKKHQVDFPAFLKKVDSLHGANIEAIYRRISEFWNNCNEIKITDWAKF